MRTTYKISIALIFFAVITGAVALVFEFETPKRSKQATVTILRGENVFQIANDLKAEGYVSSKLYFVYEALATGNFKKLKAGEYELAGLDTAAVVQKISRGEIVARNVTVVPGWDLNDVVQGFQAAQIAGAKDLAGMPAANFKNEFSFLKDAPDDSGLEGYLYPDTYQIKENQTVADLVKVILANFDQKLTPEMRAAATAQGKSIYDIVTMASLLEKEVKTLADKKTVAGILWKRLDAKMPLQVDSTILYYKAGTSGAIDKESESAYNTYRFSGLPVGPICNPGIESLEAAVYPSESPYWYYLSASDGTTIFSKNYGEHLINKAKYLGN